MSLFFMWFHSWLSKIGAGVCKTLFVQSLEILKKSFNLQSNFPDLENRGSHSVWKNGIKYSDSPRNACMGSYSVIGTGYLTETDRKLNIVIIEIVYKEESAE